MMLLGIVGNEDPHSSCTSIHWTFSGTNDLREPLHSFHRTLKEIRVTGALESSGALPGGRARSGPVSSLPERR